MNIVCEFSQTFVNSGHKSLINSSPRSRFQITQRKFNAGFSKGRVKSCSPLFRIRAAATIEAPEIKADSDVDTTVDLLACPICYKPLIRKGPSGLNLSAISGSGFQCKKCRKAYSSRDVYLDLTITGGSSEYYEYKPITTEMFRSPIVSFVYERGWRQRFATSGFPGPDEEFKMAQKYLEPAAGGLLVDASCGSGLFSRRFAKCGIYSGVVALDFSENMLRQCYEFIKGDKDLFTRNIALVRADISRLPFATGSVDAVHAGAALHCWPSPSTADKYFFTVGYHELEGRKVPLKKPLLVLRKNRLPDMMDVDSQINIPEAKSSRVELEVVGIIRQKFLFKTRPKALISKTEVTEKKIAALDASAS